MAVGTARVTTDDVSRERTFAARRILIEALALGALADATVRHAGEGLGWTFWVIALAIAAVNVAHYRGLRVTREQLTWLGTAIACAVAYAWRDAEDLRAYNVLGTLVALAMFAMCANGLPAASILAARLRDFVAAGIYSARDVIAGAPVLVGLEADLLALRAIRDGSSWRVLRILLLTTPLVIVFGLLLSRADPVFASLFRIPEIDVERVVSHLVLIGAFAWFSAGWIRGALLGSARRAKLPEELPIRLGLAEITTSLGAVIVLFTIFVVLQLRWLFGGAAVVQATTGLTVAEYARRGFFELVAVAALVLPLILGTRAVVEDERVMRRHRQLSLVLLGLLAAIMASAMLRMRLYVAYFGLTTDRLYATALMAWLALVFLAMARTVLRGWSRPFVAMAVIAGFVTLFTLNVINPELLVARVNLGRSTAAREVDYTYLARLSGDAAPTVVDALNAAAASPGSCEAAASLHKRWTARQDVAWNLGARRGAASVRATLRLCADSTVSSSQSR